MRSNVADFDNKITASFYNAGVFILCVDIFLPEAELRH